MYLAVQGFLAEFLNSTTATSRFPALTGELARLITLTDKIETELQTQQIPLTARIEARDIALEKATHLAIELAGTLLGYARKHGLVDLEVEATISSSRFKRWRIAQRMYLAQRLYTLAEPLQAQLTEFGLTGTALAEFKATVEAAQAAVDSRVAAAAEKKVATVELVGLFAEADRVIDVIDPMLVRLRSLDREAHNGYLAARAVFNRPGTRGSDDNAPPAPGANAAPATTSPAVNRIAA